MRTASEDPDSTMPGRPQGRPGVGGEVGYLLRQLLRPDAVPTSAQEASLWASAPELLELARTHRVSGLLAVRLAVAECKVPPGLVAELQQDRQANELRHLLAVRELGALDGTIDVDWAVVKGPVLSSHWYGEAGARGYSDIDVLVHPKEFEDALESLRGLGYRELADNWQGFQRHEVAEVPLRRDGHTVDLHWHLVGSGPARRGLRLATAGLLERAATVDMSGVSVPTLHPVDTLLHLCVHSGLSGARRLLHLVDVDVVVRSGELEWDAVVRRARAERCAALVMAVLDRAVDVLGSPVPDSVRERLAPNPLLRGSVRALGRLRSDGVTGLGVPIEGLRDSAPATGRITAERVVEAVRTSLGGTPPTEDPEGISWQGPPSTPAEVAAAREAYLRFVTESHQVRPTRDASHLLQLFGDEQPRTTMPLAHAVSARRLGGQTRAWVVRDRGGSAVGALVTAMLWPLVRVALPLLRDPAAAPAVARLVDRTSARLLVGFQADVGPLEPHLTRWRSEVDTKAGAIDWQGIPNLVETRSVLARPRDLDELADLLLASLPHVLPTRGLARLYARRAIERGCAVLRDEQGLGGFVTFEASTPTYSVLGTVGVRPDLRGQGLSWDLVKGLARHAQAEGRGLAAISLAQNPMSLPPETVREDPGLVVWLRHPRRFRGEPRLWRAAEAVAKRLQP